ncbi:hypothetical protein Tco_0982791 [Tanacetum coccineum]
MVQALIHTARSLRTVFIKHKVKVITNGPMEETLKLAGREGRLGKWATEIRTYDISYIQRKEAEGPVVKKFFGQGEQVGETPDANKGGIFDLSKGFQANSTPTTRAWRLYLGRRKPYTGNKTRKKVQRGNYGCNGPIPQEVSVAIKTRPSLEETSSSKKGKAINKALGAKPNCNHEASGSN